MSTRNFLAATFIGKHADATQQTEILDMLGLTDEFGMCTEDDDKVWTVGVAGPVGGRNDSSLKAVKYADRPRTSTAPASLKVLPTVREVNAKARVLRTQELAECGTESARRRHRRKKEKCEACARPPRVKTEKPAQPSRRRVASCGTNSGYKRHHRLGSPVCEPCRLAHNENTRKTSFAKPRRRAECGTPAGYSVHKRLNTEACQPCKDAANAYARKRRAEKNAGLPPKAAVRGDGHWNAKVTEKQIQNMMWMRSRRWNNNEIAREIGVHPDSVSRLLSGRGRVPSENAA